MATIAIFGGTGYAGGAISDICRGRREGGRCRCFPQHL
jgi:hypothetical protein